MNFKSIQLTIICTALILITSCTAHKTAKVVPESMINDLTPAFNAGKYDSKVDGLIVLMDTSSSMAELFEGYRKFDIAKSFVDHMNQTIPPIPAITGIRTFGHAPELSSENTELFYGMAPYNREKIKAVVSGVKPPGGPTPMTDAIKAVKTDLEKITGNKAMIIVSDGKDLDDSPYLAARQLQADLGENLCIYTVLVGEDEPGKMLLEKISSISSCGYMILAQNTIGPEQMSGYVADVLLTQASDIGLGYTRAESLTLDNVHFNFDEFTLTPVGKQLLGRHLHKLMHASDIKIVIEGHTSAKGTHAYNQTLSEKRAKTVRDYLVNTGLVAPERLTTIGFGETRPIAVEADPKMINSPEAKLNMRVVFTIKE